MVVVSTIHICYIRLSIDVVFHIGMGGGFGGGFGGGMPGGCSLGGGFGKYDRTLTCFYLLLNFQNVTYSFLMFQVAEFNLWA
jgi:hypothetical protein